MKTVLNDNENNEIDLLFESLFDYAMESTSGHILDPKTRDSLPDDAFGIVYTDSEGKRQRKYPLVVKSKPDKTMELIYKSLSMFHYCKPEWKDPLAKKIMQVIKDQKLKVNINKKSQILRHVTKNDIPSTVTIVENK